jgi:hypothetical protein
LPIRFKWGAKYTKTMEVVNDVLKPHVVAKTHDYALTKLKK